MSNEIKMSDVFGEFSIGYPSWLSDDMVRAALVAIRSHDQQLARIAELEDGIKLILECESQEDMYHTALQLLEQSK